MHWANKKGFTVVEVFLVITLLAIVVGLMVVPVHQLVENIHVRPLEETVLSAVRRAHMQARQLNEPVVLYHMAESNVLGLATAEGELLEEISVGVPDEESNPFAFYRIIPEDPQNDSMAYENEDESVDSIVFHPSGVATPFAIELLHADIRLVIDPFSSEPLLREVGGHES